MSGNILVVDSDSATRIRTIAVLMPAGYHVSIAEDPLQAASVAVAESPDLVLLGDSMTHASGLSIVGRLFSSPETARIPVVIIANTPEHHAAADQAGARAVIAGPLEPADLLRIVDENIHTPGAMPGAPASLLNDADRLAAVTAIRADLKADANLDQFTQLASKLLQVPISTITLIERDQQVFISQIGLAEPWASRGATPLEYSYCQYAVTSRAPLRIDDATAHPLVENSPAIGELNVQSYLGIPLITSDDHAVGTLCVIDSHPRHWTDSEVSILNDLAGILTAQLDTIVRTSGRHSAA
jgi:CheY-like chemotaxis protein